MPLSKYRAMYLFRFGEPLNNSWRRRRQWILALCGVANPRRSQATAAVCALHSAQIRRACSAPGIVQRFLGRLAAAALPLALLAGCNSLDGVATGVARAVTPYRVEVVQGNFVSREQVQAVQPGMGRQQVRDILGTPLVASVFHAERWEYAFTINRPGVPPQVLRLTVFFDGERLARVEGDEMPSEAEFVASLTSSISTAKAPPLQASEAQLARWQAAASAAAQQQMGDAAPPPAGARQYPPLEPQP